MPAGLPVLVYAMISERPVPVSAGLPAVLLKIPEQVMQFLRHGLNQPADDLLGTNRHAVPRPVCCHIDGTPAVHFQQEFDLGCELHLALLPDIIRVKPVDALIIVFDEIILRLTGKGSLEKDLLTFQENKFLCQRLTEIHGNPHLQEGFVAELLKTRGFEVCDTLIIPDEKNIIQKALLTYCDQGVHLILTTGGTGFSARDITPEATKEVIERETPGIAEYMRLRSMEITPRGMLSRGIAGIRDKSLIVNLPGSPKGAVENLGFVLPSISHGLDMLNGKPENSDESQH